MSDPISRLNAALEGRYRVERELGEGGMATVYLAHDVRHERRVALKVLKPDLAAVVGGERFLAEIKTTANLQHPHILPLFDSGEADGFLFYVMPYVEGETLRARLAREQQLPVDEAVRIATNVAEALDQAHRQGVIHRDVKPANILLRDGKPLVSDFGIALAVGAAGGSRLTETGLSLGTPHYMSPEQATGDVEVGVASDVYSVGCVLYEMLAGAPPHEGRTAQAVLGKILTETPKAPRSLRSTVPPHVDAVVRKALERVPADRFRSAADFVRALADPAFRHAGDAAVESAAAGGRGRPVVAAGVAVVALAASFGLGRLMPSSESGSPPVTRYRVGFETGERIQNNNLAISRDGSRIAYVGPSPDGTGTGIWILERDELDGRHVPGTRGALRPFFSPDGSRIGFVAPDRSLRVSTLDGDDTLILIASGTFRSGAAWGEDGYIYVDTSAPEGLVRVPVTGGGPPEPVFAETVEADVEAHAFPSLLPDGAGAVLTVWHNTQSDVIAAIDLETGSLTELVEGVVAVYSPTGHLVYVEADGSMFAAPFDPGSRSLTGPPVLLEELGNGFQQFVMSDDGRLAYASLPPMIDQAVWVDREGNETPLDAEAPVRNVRFLAISPDGRRLAITTREHPSRDDSQIWMKELPDGPLTRLTFEGLVNFRPEWFGGSDSILFVSDRAGNRDVWKQRADGSGEARLVFDDSLDIDEALISPDGRWLVYREGNQDGERDIYARLLGSDGPAVPVAASEFDEAAPTLSPDGRWLAYNANVEGQWNVYIRPFPEGVGQWRVSRDGGLAPVWGPDGRELFYQTPGDRVAAVSVSPGDPLSVGPERVLFGIGPYWIDAFHRRYDIDPGGARFAMVRAFEADRIEYSLVVVENFHTELRARVPD